MNYYRLQTKFAKIMFSQVSVCSGGGCLPHCMLGYTPPGQVHPPEQTPGRYTPRQVHHPPRQVHPPPTPPRQVHPLGRYPLPSACWDTHPPAGIHTPCSVHAGIHTPPAQCMLGYSQQAGGTHSIGMHSCLEKSSEIHLASIFNRQRTDTDVLRTHA